MEFSILEMAHFLLVHGAWHGGWCWQHVVSQLARDGHRAHAVTLTGLGERAHLLAPSITLETHIADVVQALVTEELEQPVLVVHSYAGMLGTAVADRMGERLSHLVYLDAVLPEPGESWCSTHADATRQARMDSARQHPQFAFAPPDPAAFGLTGADHAWVSRRQTAHPGHTYGAALDFDPHRVTRVPRTYIHCTHPPLATIDVSRRRAQDPHFWGGAWWPGARNLSLATGHDPMISAPEDLCRQLLRCAA